MPNLVGIGLSQVPTNSMLGGLAYQDPEHASIKDLDLRNLSQINSEIADTAGDVFVYDTRKDSDGGAWRKRTQHTSWYNETLGTATRGTRKEFPAVAVIVAESNQVTIYDGDDPDLPMWMVFKDTVSNMINTHNVNPNSFSLSALNANVLVGSRHPSYGEANVINFISDNGVSYYSAHSGDYRGSISQRNDGLVQTINSNYGTLVNSIVNDIAMTVLPNAPIDETTGLPIPTIAVATNAGVSVIKDDGSVIDITSTGNPTYDKVNNIKFTKDNKIVYTEYNGGSTYGWMYVHDIPSSDTSITLNSQSSALSYYDTRFPLANFGQEGWIRGTSIPQGDRIDSIAVGDGLHIYVAPTGNSGFTFIEDNRTADKSSLMAYVTRDFNTGWMHGDIKGAFLSDTDTTNIANHSSGNLINYSGNNAGDFNSADDLNAWTGSGLSHDAANSRLVADKSVNSNFSVDGILTIGKRYELSWDVASQSPSYGKVMLNSTTAGSAVTLETGSGTGSYEFTAADTDLDFYLFNGGSNHVANINSITIVPVVDDRSVNKNGLQVFGTITKSAVAAGADLVAYSGFSNSNVLVQPYNSDLNPGTGNYSFMCWFKCSSTSAEQIIMRRFGNPTVTGGMMLRVVSSSSVLQWYVRGTDTVGYVVNTSNVVDDNVWHCVVGTREGGTAKLYLDGQLIGSQSVSTISHDPGSTAKLVIGAEEVTNSPGTFQNSASNCSLALIRYSLSVPSPEQIKKIYEDEKHLFQENAKATLYGSSDAVTALAYDDSNNVLHVGTSAGRSEFQGLRRINNTTTAVTTAISASNGLVAEQ